MDDTNSLIEQRKAKLAALRARGIDPFKKKSTPAETCAAARAHYTESHLVALAGLFPTQRASVSRTFSPVNGLVNTSI